MNNKQLALEHKHSGMKRSEHHSGFGILCIDQNILNYKDRNENITAIKVILQYPILKKYLKYCCVKTFTDLKTLVFKYKNYQLKTIKNIFLI